MEENKNSYSDVIWKMIEKMFAEYDELHMVVDVLPASVSRVEVFDKIYDTFFSCWKEKIRECVEEGEGATWDKLVYIKNEIFKMGMRNKLKVIPADVLIEWMELFNEREVINRILEYEEEL